MPRMGGHLRIAVVAAGTWVLLSAIFIASPVVPNGDSYLIVPSAHSLVYEGNLGLDEFMEQPHIADHYGLRREGGGEPVYDRHGNPTNYFPWLTSVAEIPALLLLDGLSTFGLTANSSEKITSDQMAGLQSVGAGPVAALAAVILGLATRELLRLRRDTYETEDTAFQGVDPEAWWVVPAAAGAIGLGTTIWSTAALTMWQHGLAVLLLGGAFLMVLRIMRRGDDVVGMLPAWCGFLLGLAYWSRPTTVVLTAGLLTMLALRSVRLAATALVGACVAWLIVAALNLYLLGVVVPPYFAGSRLRPGWNVFEVVAANLVSPARGLLVFSPFLVLLSLLFLPGRNARFGRTEHRVVLPALASCCVYLVAISSFPHWWAGHSFGPRLLTELAVLIGPLTLLAVYGRQVRTPVRRFVSLVVAPALIAISIVIHGLGSWTHASACWAVYPVNIDEAPERIWAWRDPLVTMGFRMVLPPGNPLKESGGDCDPDRAPLF